MSVARRNLKEAGGETRPRRTGIGYKANDRGVSRPNTVKPESCPDAAGVNPAGTAGKRQGLPWEASGSVRRIWTTASAMALDGHGGVSRRHSTGPRRAGKGETSWCGEQTRMTRWAWSRGKRHDGPALAGVVRHLGGGEAGSRSARPQGSSRTLTLSMAIDKDHLSCAVRGSRSPPRPSCHAEPLAACLSPSPSSLPEALVHSE